MNLSKTSLAYIAFGGIISILLWVILLANPDSDRVSSVKYDESFAVAAKTWLLENPELLLEAIAVLEQREQVAQSDQDQTLITQNASALFASDQDGYIGEGEPVIVEFFDYQCGYCKQQSSPINSYAENNPDKRIILKEFPILGPVSETAARMAIATRRIHGNEAYIAFHKDLLAHRGSLDDSVLDGLITEHGYNIQDVREAMTDSLVDAELEANRLLASKMGITGTPGFVFRKSIARGFLNLEQLTRSASAG